MPKSKNGDIGQRTPAIVKAIGDHIFIYGSKERGWDLTLMAQIGKDVPQSYSVRIPGWNQYRQFCSREDARVHRDDVICNLATNQPVVLLMPSPDKTGITIRSSDFDVKWEMPKQYQLHARKKDRKKFCHSSPRSRAV